MNFLDTFSQLFRSPRPLDVFVQFNQPIGRPKPSHADVDQALNALSEAILCNKKGKALSVARALLLLLGPHKAIKRIQRDGTFRASRHAFNSPVVRALIADWTENAGSYGFNAAGVKYLTSVSALWTLAPALKKVRRSLVERMKVSRPRVIKTLLAVVDIAFAHGMPGDRELPTELPYAYSTEEMAAAFSYLLCLFHAEFGLDARHFQMVDESAVMDTMYQDLLVDAAKVCDYLEAEVLIDAFPYSAVVRHGKVFVIADDPALEKSIRLGYVQTDMQRAIRIRALMEYQADKTSGEILSVASFAKTYYEAVGDVVVEFAPTPVPRYRVMFPQVNELKQIFAGDGLFLEDLSSVEMLGAEDYVSASEIIDSPVVGDITVIDILKVQRFFSFMHFGIHRAVSRHSPLSDRPFLYLNSCLPVFEHRKLVEGLQHLLGKEKAEEIVRLLTCDLSSDFVDLQYTPIVIAGEWCIFSMAVLSSSNLVRNLLCHNAKRLTMRNKGDIDPMQAALKTALYQAGFLVQDQVITGTKNNTLEVDVLAYRDGHLFLFECKNSFHPCNVYEMRTSYDHVTHAADQLAQRRDRLLDAGNQQRVFDRLSWKVDVAGHVHTCIAIGNRVFNGYDCDGHPVRQVHELLNFILRGSIAIDGVTRRVWKNETFSVEDLCMYLAGVTTIADFMESMEPLDRKLSFGGAELTFSSYVLNGETLTSLSEARYSPVEIT